ncbi:hypothetical protein BABINDRAFT_162121 [Babjeviella inositovora NRRL Y-12698]|uniref:Uncharacterized protein n=1 Tax=Babjeviella inositovora NRRL Y-12698 TaxID=984486 RepID=A0A1E3QMY0_9ASCO|nr:uncharacterized protein BABINDRAFT_162121 [Babjeviella inositovora NRRL Y-12698]ODQ79049.1 hypothetical protein BABINDRAFT_162121 [Babjeviella inositovora NRRL Y-12698]
MRSECRSYTLLVYMYNTSQASVLRSVWWGDVSIRGGILLSFRSAKLECINSRYPYGLLDLERHVTSDFSKILGGYALQLAFH